MLEIATSLPGVSQAAPAPPGTNTAPGGFARALADARAEAGVSRDRQESAAPGKTALAALPGTAPAVAARDLPPVSRVLGAKPEPVDSAPIDPEADDDATPSESITTPADGATPEQPQGQPVSGYLNIVILSPVALAPPADGAGVGASDAAPTASLVAITAPASQPSLPDTAPPVGVEPASPPVEPLAKTPVSRRLTLKLDPSIEVIDPGRGRSPAPADQSLKAQPTLRVTTTDLPPAIPLSVKAEAVLASGAAQPAAHAFARAIAQAQARSTRLEPSIDATDLAPVAQAIAASDARPVVLAPRALDLTREDWPQRLIDRVDAVRDAANAGDTRIRLVPEALGRIDIALRQDGKTLHVHFTADQAATRDLIAQAQPRLAELAEARGLRLGQAGVDGGSSDQPRRTPTANTPVANRPASGLQAEITTGSDGRIA